MAVAILSMLAGCSGFGGDRVLSAHSARKALKKEPMFAPGFAVAPFPTGTYAVDSCDVATLDMLAAAGVVEYSVDTVAAADSVALMATVRLTESGLEYDVPVPAVMHRDDEEDLEANIGYEEPRPPYIMGALADTAAADTAAVEWHNMLLGNYVLDKVKEVRCTENMAADGEGSCKALIVFRDKTPFGHALGAPREDFITVWRVDFRYYNDIGWRVYSLSDE